MDWAAALHLMPLPLQGHPCRESLAEEVLGPLTTLAGKWLLLTPHWPELVMWPQSHCKEPWELQGEYVTIWWALTVSPIPITWFKRWASRLQLKTLHASMIGAVLLPNFIDLRAFVYLLWALYFHSAFVLLCTCPGPLGRDWTRGRNSF